MSRPGTEVTAVARDLSRMGSVPEVGRKGGGEQQVGAVHDGEQAIRAGELEWTILRPSSFASNTLSWAEAIRSGTAVSAAGPRLREDCWAFCAPNRYWLPMSIRNGPFWSSVRRNRALPATEA
jgi:hypothetical protein